RACIMRRCRGRFPRHGKQPVRARARTTRSSYASGVSGGPSEAGEWSGRSTMVHGDETLDPGMGDIGHIQPSQLQRGWDVFGSEGDKIGDLEEVRDEYIIVSRGFLFTTERFIPLWAVSTAGDGKVFLNVTKDEIETRGWDNAEAVARSRPAGTGEMRGRETRASQTDEMLGRETRAGDTGEMLGRETRTSPTGETEERMEIREEELRTRKREVEAGAVDVEREVVTERETRE